MTDQTTLSEAKHALLNKWRKGQVRAAPGIVARGDQRKAAPLSFAQQRLWFLDQLDPGNAAYHIPSAVRLRGQLDRAALQGALDAIVARHEALRTRFDGSGAEPLQWPVQAAQTPIELVDMTGAPAAQVAAAVAAMARAPFDLAGGVLLRAALLRLAEDEHVAVLVMHHIVSDGWSMGVLVSELALQYSARVRGLAASLPPLPIQYADFACWQRDTLGAAALQQQLDYWRTRLDGAPALLELPTDRVRGQLHAREGGGTGFHIGASVAAALRAVAADGQASLFMVLQAAFSVLLSRYSGQNDICIGTPVANRARTETADLIGFFVNTLVLRTDVAAHLPFSGLLRQVRGNTLDAYAHQDLPFEQLVDALKPARSMAHTPLFQVMLVLQNTPMGRLELPGLQLEPIEADTATAKFDLTLTVMERDDGLACRLEYDRALFDQATADRMGRHVALLLDSVAADPSVPVSALAMLDAAENGQLLSWNARSAYRLPAATIAQAFEAQAALRGDAEALRCGEQALSYAQLNARANRIAHWLRGQGVGPEVLVGLYVERSLDAVVGMLAVAKAGGAYLPLDPVYPAERVAFMLADAAPMLVLTQQTLRSALPPAMPALCLDDCAALPEANANPAPAACADNLAYVIYTSGSTGKPKGAMLTHANVLRLFAATAERFCFGPADCWTMFHSHAFDFSVWEIWGALLHGGRLVVVPPMVARAPDQFHALLVREGVTVLNQTPSAFAQLVAADAASGAALSLRLVVFGGEALNAPLLAPWFARHGDAVPQLVNMYGITETTVHVTCQVLTAGGAAGVGRALGDLGVYVLDAQLNLAPVGVPGELYIAGAGLARGYLKRAQLTAQRFIPDPFDPDGGARLYRSGDLGRYLADGSIEYRGRIDSQVKLRGFRIELGEIEAALAAQEGVDAALVLADGDHLVAYVAGVAAADSLRAALLRTLPDYMVPAHFVVLDAFSLTANGKLDRAALPAPALQHAAAGYVAPRSMHEVQLAQVWADVLRVERVGVFDNFFALGGHSLLATQVVSQLRARHALELPLRALFDQPDLAALAAIVASLPQTTPLIVPVARGQVMPVSFAQQRMWFLDQLAPGNPFYNMPFAVRLQGALDACALERAVNAVIARHEVLRTNLTMGDGLPVLQIHAVRELTLAFTDLSACAGAERDALLERALAAEAVQAFQLDAGPLLRTCLVRLGAEEHIFMITLHHVVSDGWSIGILIQELAACYGACRDGLPVPLAPLALQYADYAHWQRGWLDGALLQAQLDYWVAQLAGAPAALALPTDRPRPAAPSYRGASFGFTIPSGLTAALRLLGETARATLFMSMCATFHVLLARLSGEDDIVVGTPIAGRNRAEVEPLVGLFLNSLALRLELDDNPPFAEVLERMRHVALDAYANQDLPFERLVDALGLERDASRSPLFQAMFVLQNMPMEPIALPGLHIEALGAESAIAKFDLSLYALEQGESIACRLEYSTDLFERGTVERFAQAYLCLLEAVTANPATPIRSLPMLAPAEAESRLHDWEASQGSLSAMPAPDVAPAFDDVLEPLLRYFDKAPQASAIEWMGTSCSYAELDRQSAALAHTLRSTGVQAGDVVALLLADPVANIVATVGVLRAGAVFAALDHRQPALRREACLMGAAPRAIVTDLACQSGALVLQFAAAAAGAARAPTYVADGDAPCYLYFTSGSTGTPKGVLGRRASLAHFIDWEIRQYALNAGARLGQLTNPGFDVYLRDVFGALCAGGTLCIPDSPDLLASGQLCAWLEQAGVTHLHCVPTVFRLMLQEALTPERLAPLRHVLLAGEMLLPADVNPWIALFGARIGLTNLYGPTETTLAKFFYRVPALAQHGSAVPVGRPLPGAQGLILNESMELCTQGELYIRTPYRSLGYAGRPDLTAAAFVPNPFGSDAGDLLYRTGDRARLLADGQFQLLGRLDQQLKIRGVRVEPGEIEAALAAIPGVQAAVVLAQAAPGGARLVGYLTGTAPDDAQVLAALGARLPDYMLPSRLLRLAAMPLSANGKVDRKRLPKADFDAAAVAYAAPRNALEQAVADIWAALLQREQVGIDDNFFALGGHSLLATQMVARVRRLCQVQLALRAVFEAPTVALLAARIAQLRAAGAALPPALAPVAREGRLALSFAQQRLWFLDRMESERAFYLMPAAVRLRGVLDVEALRAAIGAVVQRHEALRTSFPDVDGEAHQHISESVALAMPLADLSMHPEAEREEQLRWAMQNEAQGRFDLAHGPLLRVRLLRMAPQDHVCLLTMHHIVSDGWSMGVLVNEISALYAAFAAGLASPLPALAVQYADYAHWQRNWMQGEALAAQLDYWRTRLAGAPALLDVPTDFARPGQQSVAVEVCSGLLPAAQVAALRSLAQRQGASLFMALHALLCALLARWSGQDDVVIGTVVAGRTQEATEGLIGCFMNSLALRHRCDAGEDLHAMLTRIAQGTLDAFAHQDAPFEQVIEAVRPVRDVRHNPVFNVGFLLQNLPATTALGGELLAEAIGGGGQSTTLDLRFVARERDGGIVFECEYKTELFSATTASLLVDGFAALLDQWSADPAMPMVRLDPGAALLAQTAAARRRERRHQIVVAASFTAEPLADAMGFWGRTLGQSVQLQFAPYGQVLPALLDPAGPFAVNRSGSNLLLLRLEDWVRDMRDAPPEAALQRMEGQGAELVAAVAQAQAGAAAPLFIQFAPMSQAAATQAQYRDYLNGLESRLCAQLGAIPGAYPLTSAGLLERYPLVAYDDAYADQLGHIPYTSDMYAALATSFMRAHAALQRRPRKVIVLDCDETLWRGVCGETGPLGVELTPGHLALQAFMAARQESGMLLCLCSKNNGADVDAVFEQHPGMLLQARHIVARRVNWLAKSANLQSLAAQLDLGLDSFIFVDDNPVECAEVRAACPEVLVLQLPPAADDYGQFLDHVWAFDQLVVTADAQDRTTQYRQNGERDAALGQAASYQAFLDALELKVVIAPALPEQLERVAELTRRTNQFNLRPHERNAAELQAVAPGQRCLAVQVSDRFGDYGLAGALLWQADGDALRVDAFLLSCRVLGRGVEHRIVAALAHEALALGLTQVYFAAADSGRNEPALSFLASVAQATHTGAGQLAGFVADARVLAAMPARVAAPAPRARPSRQALAIDPLEHDTELHIAHTLSGAVAIARAVEASLMRQSPVAQFTAPQSATELAIAAIWQQVLRIERIGVDDNFFALGGHSLQITQIVSRIKRTLTLEVPIGLLFTLSTVAALAAHIDAELARLQDARRGEEDAFDEIASLLGNLDE